MANKMYHVAQKWDGKNLQTAARRMGELVAIEAFCKKWDTEDGVFAASQVTNIYLYETLADAKRHQMDYGGEILEIDVTGLDFVRDPIEGYLTYGPEIEACRIRKL